MPKIFLSACWALAMILLALLARFGWADRNAVETMLLVMPLLAVVSLQRGGRCGPSAREA